MEKRGLKARFVRIMCAVLLLCTVFSLCGCSDDEEQIESMSQLNGKTIVAVSGTVNSVPVKQRSDLADAEIRYVPDKVTAVPMVLGGKADAMVVDNIFALSMVRKYDGLVILNEMLDSEKYGIAFENGNGMRDSFSKVIKTLKRDGTMSAMIQKWTGDDAEAKTVREQTWAGANGTLTCCVAPDNEPVCYKNDAGELLGLDIDLVLTIAEKLDLHIEFTETEFEDVLPTLVAGQADLAASGISVTQERDELVDFTEGYLEAGTVLIVRNTEASGEGALLSLKNDFHRVFVENDRWAALLKGLGITIALSVTTTATGLIFGTVAYLRDYSGSKAAKKIFSALYRIVELLPSSTYLIIIFYLLFSGKSGSGFWAAFVAFTISFGLVVYDELKTVIGAINQSQVEAAYAMGYGKFQALRKILMPQALPQFLVKMQTDIVGHIRMTALVEFIAVQDLQAVSDMIRAETNEPLLTVILPALVYAVLAAAASNLIGHIRINLDPAAKTPEEIKARALKGKL